MPAEGGEVVAPQGPEPEVEVAPAETGSEVAQAENGSEVAQAETGSEVAPLPTLFFSMTCTLAEHILFL